MFDYTFQWRPALRALPDMLAGAWVTFETAALSMIFGVLIALVLTVMRQARHPLLRGVGNGWVSIARNTPSLFQIYILYFGLGSLGLHVSSWLALLAGITFNTAGYLAENFRGGLKAVPGTQMRAARSATSCKSLMVPRRSCTSLSRAARSIRCSRCASSAAQPKISIA